jgi:hypothetical protein
LEYLPKTMNALADACIIGKEDAAQTPPFQPLQLNTSAFLLLPYTPNPNLY